MFSHSARSFASAFASSAVPPATDGGDSDKGRGSGGWGRAGDDDDAADAVH